MKEVAGVGMGLSMYDEGNDGYPELERALKVNFKQAVSEGAPLFTTSAEGLFDLFLANIPSEARQHYTCRACENFVNRFGRLVTLSEDGTMKTVMWDYNVPSFFIPAVNAVINVIEHSKVTGVFYSEDRVWGTPVTGPWTHMSVTPPPNMVHRDRLQTAGQKMAQKLEDYGMLQRALHEYSLPTIQQAVTLLKSEALYRSEKTLGVAEWFVRLATMKKTTRNHKVRDNIIWLAVATAPSGFAHVRSSMIGTLLDDIQSGMDFGSVKARFEEKMNPLKYQRPQAAPSAGNIAQAEKIVEKLGIARSLERRFARLDEIETLWKPTLPKQAEQTGGVFGHLKTKDASEAPKAMALPNKRMTWRKFLETVLPHADTIEYHVRPSNDAYTGIVTAEHADAPPILQWDSEERRNPFSWYLYNGGSSPAQWNLGVGWVKVTGIAYQPSMWYDVNAHHAHHGASVIFLLEDAKDMRMLNHSGNVLFPETLKAELREIRSTIEAYSKEARLGGYDEASACGIRLQNGLMWNATVRVANAMGTAAYTLDRWD